MRPLVALTLLLAVTATSCTVGDPPPLPEEPSVEELQAHAGQYCQKLAMCTLGQAPPDCMDKMMSHNETPAARKQAAVVLNMFGDCMALDCIGMTACFTTASAKALIDVVNKTPTVPGPKAPPKGP